MKTKHITFSTLYCYTATQIQKTKKYDLGQKSCKNDCVPKTFAQ